MSNPHDPYQTPQNPGRSPLPSREYDLPQVQNNPRIKIVRLVAGVAEEIVGHLQAISILSYGGVEF